MDCVRWSSLIGVVSNTAEDMGCRVICKLMPSSNLNCPFFRVRVHLFLGAFGALPRIKIHEKLKSWQKRACNFLLENIKFVYFSPNIEVYLRMIDQVRRNIRHLTIFEVRRASETPNGAKITRLSKKWRLQRRRRNIYEKSEDTESESVSRIMEGSPS